LSRGIERDIIVVGASAGGVEVLQTLASTLPADIPATLFMVMHFPSWARSELPHLLLRSGPLPAVHPQSGERFEHGKIYVAPPDRHMLLEEGKVVLWRGPKENRYRPSVNALFRSAAVSYGPRVTGVILTGALDDGSAGLWWVRRHGGFGLVQDPAEALFPDMPLNALQYVDSAYTARVEEMGGLLYSLAKGEEFEACNQQKRA